MKEFNKTQELRKIKFKQNKNTYIKRVSIILSCVILVIGIIYFTFAKFESSSNSYTLIQGLVKYNPSFNVIGEASGIVEKFDGYSDTVETIDEGIYETENEEDRCTYTLAYDGTVDNNLRYVGKNPCNYVSYNNELWRIIGYMNNMYTSESDYNNKTNGQTLMKLVRYESLGKYSWDSSNSSVNSGYGINQWGPSGTYEGADLMRELNTDYLGNITVGRDGKWYNGRYNEKSATMPVTLSQIAIEAIQQVIWNLGSPTNDNGSYIDYTSTILTAMYVYNHERTSNTGKICSYSDMCNDSVYRESIWLGSVALPYASDFGFGTSGGNDTNRGTCLNNAMRYYYRDDISDCLNNNWIYDRTYNQFYLSPYAIVSNLNYATHVANSNSAGRFGVDCAAKNYIIHPTLYLKSSVKITGGEGSKDNPYILGID